MRRSPGAALAAAELPPGFERWRVRLDPGAERASAACEWEGALVLVERGTLDVECVSGGRRRFASGSLVALGWLPLRVLRNPGRVPVEVVAVRRVASGR